MMISKLSHRATPACKELPPVDTLLWPAMPDPMDEGRTGSRKWIWPHYRGMFQVAPGSAHGEGYLLFPFAASVFDRRGVHILTVALEQIDYRMLAQLTGEALKDIAPDPRQRFSPVTTVIYRSSTRDEVGPCTEARDVEQAAAYLCNIVMDELDLSIDPLVKQSG